jgi:hypothetical protein
LEKYFKFPIKRVTFIYDIHINDAELLSHSHIPAHGIADIPIQTNTQVKSRSQYALAPSSKCNPWSGNSDHKTRKEDR